MSDWEIVVPTATTNYVRNPSAGSDFGLGSEMLTNGGFETAGGGGADVFGSWAESAGDGAIADEGAIVVAGSHAAKLTAGATANTHVAQDVTVTAKKLYRFAFYARGDATNSGRYYIYDVTNAAYIVATVTVGVTAAAYSYKAISVVAPTGCASIRLGLYCPATNGGIAYFDGVSVYEVTAGAAHLGDAADINLSGNSFYGHYGYGVATVADNEGALFALSTLTNAAHYVTLMVRGTLPAAWDWSLDNSTYTAPTKLYDVDANWDMYGLAFPAAQANGSTALYVRQNGAGAGTFYADGLQVEPGTTWTTYCDGTRPGCEWLGAEHNSASSRSAVSCEGGTVYDLYDDLGLIVESYLGTGMAPRATTQSGYAGQAGGALNDSIRTSRAFTLVCFINSTTYLDLLDKRNVLADLLSPESYPRTAEGWQPRILRHTGGTTLKTIRVHYEAGLEADQTTNLPIHERVALRFFAPDPNWYATGDSAGTLDTNDSLTIYGLAGRLKSTGQWSVLGNTAAPAGGGGTVEVYAICVAKDKSIYFGGNFDGFNNESPTGADYVVRYKPYEGTWHVLVGASDVNGIVYAITEGPDGTIYLGGAFTAVNGVGTADYVVAYNPSTDTWSSLGDPANGGTFGSVRAFAFDSDGNLYAGGQFTEFAGVAAADCLAKWDGTSWTAVGATALAIGDAVYTIAIDPDDNIYIGGAWDGLAGDVDIDNWAWWNGTAWAAPGAITLDNTVYALKSDFAGNIYAGGLFTNAGANADADYIFKWTGTDVIAMPGSAFTQVRNLIIAPDGSILASGIAVRPDTPVMRWNGSSWTHLDISPMTVYAAATSPASAVTNRLFDLYVGTGSSAETIAGDATVTPAGSAPIYPEIHVKRSGGTSASLYDIRNATTGRELSCVYDLLNGEELTIDLHPNRQTVTSSFFGPRPDAILAGSDIGSFALLPGANIVTAHVETAGSPTITAYVLWRDAWDGLDD